MGWNSTGTSCTKHTRFSPSDYDRVWCKTSIWVINPYVEREPPRYSMSLKNTSASNIRSNTMICQYEKGIPEYEKSWWGITSYPLQRCRSMCMTGRARQRTTLYSMMWSNIIYKATSPHHKSHISHAHMCKITSTPGAMFTATTSYSTYASWVRGDA